VGWFAGLPWPPPDGGAGDARNLDLIAEATDPQNLLLLAKGKGDRDQLGLAW
jgi:hypothetical protein